MLGCSTNQNSCAFSPGNQTVVRRLLGPFRVRNPFARAYLILRRPLGPVARFGGDAKASATS
jgi:hypothetical protein